MSDAHGRPRPQYGEYATPEEQRARIAHPDLTDALDAGVRPDAAPVAPEPARAVRRPRVADRIVTIALLAYGFLNVMLTAPRLFDFAAFADDYLALMGSSATFTNDAAAAVWGPAAGILYIAGWVATALLSWWRMRRGGLAFWIPLAGAVVTTVAVAACLTVPLAGDPAIMGLVDSFAPR